MRFWDVTISRGCILLKRVKSITEDLREQENASASSKVNKKDAEKASIARKGEELLFNLMKVGQELSLN